MEETYVTAVSFCSDKFSGKLGGELFRGWGKFCQNDCHNGGTISGTVVHGPDWLCGKRVTIIFTSTEGILTVTVSNNKIT